MIDEPLFEALLRQRVARGDWIPEHSPPKEPQPEPLADPSLALALALLVAAHGPDHDTTGIPPVKVELRPPERPTLAVVTKSLAKRPRWRPRRQVSA